MNHILALRQVHMSEMSATLTERETTHGGIKRHELLSFNDMQEKRKVQKPWE